MKKRYSSLIVSIVTACLATSVALAAPANRNEVRVIPERPPQKPNRAQMFADCMKDPACRDAMELGARNDNERAARPAAQEPSPEEKALLQMQRGAVGPPQTNSNWIRPIESLLEMINPIPSAHAASFYISPTSYESEASFSASLTPSRPYVSNPYSYLLLYGARVYGTSNYLYGSVKYSPSPQSEDRPYVHFRTTVPEGGEYLVNVQASRAQARSARCHRRVARLDGA